MQDADKKKKPRSRRRSDLRAIGNFAVKDVRRELATAFTMIETPEEMEQTFIDFLTVSEQRDLYSRWLIFKMLEQGLTQREISRELGVSLCKITRGSRFLKSPRTIVHRLLDGLARHGGEAQPGGAPDDGNGKDKA